MSLSKQSCPIAAGQGVKLPARMELERRVNRWVGSGGYCGIGWICLVVVSLGIMGFGVVIAIVPMGADELLYRADGLASMGLGLLGGLLALIPYRRRERWAWIALWYYPVFWIIHLASGLPPGKDHVHQIIFLTLSLLGLLLPVQAFFPGRRTALTEGSPSGISIPDAGLRRRERS